jgi:hypothetical protein
MNESVSLPKVLGNLINLKIRIEAVYRGLVWAGDPKTADFYGGTVKNRFDTQNLYIFLSPPMCQLLELVS